MPSMLNDCPPEVSHEPSVEDCQALVNRIVLSARLAKAARLREFLVYSTAKGLEGHAEELTEQLIGFHVFHRKPDYSPGEDNVVRASARHLRGKLKEYFEDEGRDEKVILEIPKGGYLPQFRFRESPAPPGLPGAASALSPAARPHTALWLAAVSVLSILAVALALDNLRLRRVPAAPVTRDLVSAALLEDGKRLNVVLVDPALNLMADITGEWISFEAYAEGRFQRRGWLFDRPDPRADHLWDVITQRPVASLADMGIVTRLLTAHPESTGRISVRHARHLTMRDLKQDNFLLLGGSRANPWARLFEENLNFQQVGGATGSSSAVGKYLNRQPRPGELREYTAHDNMGRTGLTYGRISVISNPLGDGRVIHLSGLNQSGAEAVGDFALSPAALATVLQAAGAEIGNLASCELLLETRATAGSPSLTKLVAARSGTR